MEKLPSEYFRAHGMATFQEDPVGLYLAEPFGLVDNFAWANDYPHHEGTWPHSAEAIERNMGGLTEQSRAKILLARPPKALALSTNVLVSPSKASIRPLISQVRPSGPPRVRPR